MMREKQENTRKKGPGDWRDLGLSSLVDDIAVSFAFLSRVPVPLDNARVRRRPLAVAMRAFPLAGAVIGFAGGLAFVLAEAVGLPAFVGAVLALCALVLMTGALHEDALADMADGFGGGWTREQKLDIMKDSRVGTYGAVATLLALLLKLGALVGLEAAGGAGFVLLTLIASGAVSRGAIVVLPHLLGPAKSEGLAAQTGRPDEATAVQALILAGLVAFLTVPALGALAGLALALAATAGLGALAARQIGGQTGDVLGAGQQAAEIGFLLGVLMIV